MENVLKINTQKGLNTLGVSKIEFMYIYISYFHTFFQIPRRTLKKKILNNMDLIYLRRSIPRKKSPEVIILVCYKREGLKTFEN